MATSIRDSKGVDSELGEALIPDQVGRTYSELKYTTLAATMLLALLFVFCLGYGTFGHASNVQLANQISGYYTLNFLVVGDWGRDGQYNQTYVASEMGRVGELVRADFVISTGDNFYDDGLQGVDDAQFVSSYSAVYTAPSLRKTWYAVLGNHDYRGDAEAQLKRDLNQRDTRWMCRREFQLRFPLCANAEPGHTCDSSVDLFFIDTTPYVDEYWAPDSKHKHNWTGLWEPREEQLRIQTQNLEANVRNSTATWKIVIGHHTIRSTGHHGDTVELVNAVDPLLKAYDVDLYINGHDHCLQDIKSKDSKLRYITSGGGSKAWKGSRNPDTEKGSQFYYDGQGLLSVSIRSSSISLIFYDIFGNVLHKVELTKPIES